MTLREPSRKGDRYTAMGHAHLQGRTRRERTLEASGRHNNNNNTFIYIAPYPAGCSWRLTTQYIIVINIKVNYF